MDLRRVRLVIYEDAEQKKALASTIIRSAPSEGERWYITARDMVDGLALTVDTS